MLNRSLCYRAHINKSKVYLFWKSTCFPSWCSETNWEKKAFCTCKFDVTSTYQTSFPWKLEVVASFTVILFLKCYSAGNRTHEAVNFCIEKSWPKTTQEKKKFSKNPAKCLWILILSTWINTSDKLQSTLQRPFPTFLIWVQLHV